MWYIPCLVIPWFTKSMNSHFYLVFFRGFRSGSSSEAWVLMAKNVKKFWAKIEIYIFRSKIVIYLSLGLHKGRLSALEREHQALQNFFTFFYICWSFLPFWIRIRIQQLKLMRIRIRNPGIFHLYVKTISKDDVNRTKICRPLEIE